MNSERARLVEVLTGCTRDELLYHLARVQKTDQLRAELTKPKLASLIVEQLPDAHIVRLLRAYTGENR